VWKRISELHARRPSGKTTKTTKTTLMVYDDLLVNES